MKKIVKLSFIAAVAVAAGYTVYNQSQKAEALSDITLSEVESYAACESIGWWNNDGNCVRNDAGIYFCKSDSWHELTDCLQ